jgi:hypothetical protein
MPLAQDQANESSPRLSNVTRRHFLVKVVNLLDSPVPAVRQVSRERDCKRKHDHARPNGISDLRAG